MDPQEMDFWYKMKCLEIASKEAIDLDRLFDLKTVFERTEEIYHWGHGEGILKWDNLVYKETLRQAPKPTPEPKPNPLGGLETKPCPVCGESIPLLWKAHKFKLNGEKCTYKEE